MADKHQLLKQTFGFNSFRGHQEQVIDAIVSGNSALAVFPTGGGKSLCYQLPALMLPGLTLVISPLIALMKDQIDFLQSRNIAAARFDSTLTAAEVHNTIDRIKKNELKLLYVSPERLSNEQFIHTLSQNQISLMVVDEAHCISEWGHNFRPDYLKLVRASKRLKVESVLALTATATPEVSDDICRAFNISAQHWFQDSFHRPNLELHLTPCRAGERLQHLFNCLESRSPGPTIVYVTLQETAEWLAQQLASHNWESRAYHGGMDKDRRHEIQDWFMNSPRGIVVATIAFGMGVDKADIRYIYHYNMPKSVENYAQEIGRAGRDGAASICEAFVVRDDRVVLENFVYGDTPTPQAVNELVKLVCNQPEEFYLSTYALSAQYDVRPLVLTTLLTWFELYEFIENTGSIPSEGRFIPSKPSQEILDQFDTVRQNFLKNIFKQVRKGKKWLTLDIMSCAQKLEETPDRIVKALSYLNEKGEIHLEMSRFQQRYRILKRTETPEELVNECVERFEQRELSDLQRLDQVIEIAETPECRVGQLLSYFGENRINCGHCDICLETAQSFASPPTPRETASEIDESIIAEVTSENHNALKHPRQLARFLCGITSPAATRARLKKHPRFGSFKHLPFENVLSICESRQSLQ